MKKLFLKNNSERTFIILLAVLFLSISFGAVCAAVMDNSENTNVYKYLNTFFSSYNDNLDKNAVCRRSVGLNMRIYIPVVSAGFFLLGRFICTFFIGVKGFVWGFCSGVYIKYYGIKGILLSLASFPSYIIIFSALILFIMITSEISKDDDRKRAVMHYMIVCLMLLVLFSLSSLSDGYISAAVIAEIIPVL